ncbi:MAG: sarcinarray family MAST domain-containing protein [Methanosarcinaceae archaeon]
MKFKLMFLVLMMIFILFSGVAASKSPYGTMDVYYNDRLLPGSEVAKPVLRISEPFTLRVDATMYQECQLHIRLCLIDKTHFDIIEGGTDFNQAFTKIFEMNETHTFEWTLKPTDEWAGGTVPINIHYSVLLPGVTGAVADSSFTIAVPYISTEHYEGDSTPPTTTTPDSPPSTDSPNSIPAFTFLTTALVIALATRKQ